MKKRIVKYPDPRLSRSSVDVLPENYARVRSILFSKTAYQRNGSLGFAGNQVGLEENIFTALIQGKWKFFINPVITDQSKEVFPNTEECLSIPKKSYVVDRHSWIDLDYVDEKNQDRSQRFEGLDAIIIQHEVDHLNGITIANKNNGDKIKWMKYIY